MVAVLAILLAAPVSAGEWFQDGYDAARTGGIPRPGPEHGDAAFVARLPGTINGQIAIDNGSVFVSSVALGITNGTERSAMWRIDLDTAQVEHMFDLPAGDTLRENLAFDGERAYFSDGRYWFAWDVATGDEAWRWPIPIAGKGYHAECSSPTFGEAAIIFLACWPKVLEDPQTAPRDPVADFENLPWLVVAALDSQTGDPVWIEQPPLEQEMLPEDEDPDRVPGHKGYIYATISVGAGRVYLYTFVGTPYDPEAMQAEYSLWAFHSSDGTFDWKRSGDQRTGAQAPGVPPTPLLEPPATAYVGSYPLVGPDAVYVRFDTFQARNLATGEIMWENPVGQADLREVMGAYVLGLRDDALVATSTQTAYRLDLETGETVWRYRLPLNSVTTFATGPAVLDDRRAYLLTIDCDLSGPDLPSTWSIGFRALDLETGGSVWQFGTQENQVGDEICWSRAGPAHGEGVIVRGHLDGRVVVIGRTNASLGAPDLDPEAYPAVGETVVVDLSSTQPGVDGPATRYRADWGDGTTSDWQANPNLSHAYSEPGTVTARFVAGNKNQSVTSVVTYHVGETAPTKPNVIESIFAGENQGLTFGILGLLLVVGGFSALATARRGRRRLSSAIRTGAVETQEHLDAYRQRLAVEIEAGTPSQERSTKLRPLRIQLGITQREHAVLDHILSTGPRSGEPQLLGEGTLFLHRYRVVEALGGGAGGNTYRCVDEEIERDVVIKRLRTPDQDENDLRRVLHEARSFARVQHPAVVTLYGVEQLGNEGVLVLEHVGGGSLAARLREGPIQRDTFRSFASELLRGIEAVHNEGVIHRDIKPSNILLTPEGAPKLSDFGIAHVPHLQALTVTAGALADVAGTVQYMSPEQARGQEPTAQSDLFSTAATLYEAWTGQAYLKPQMAETAMELLTRAASRGPFDAPLQGPAALRRWFEKALHPDPSARFPDAASMRQALEKALT